LICSISFARSLFHEAVIPFGCCLPSAMVMPSLAYPPHFLLRKSMYMGWVSEVFTYLLYIVLLLMIKRGNYIYSHF